MLSDSCFECVDQLLEAICNYEYSDTYKSKLIQIIRKLNEIRDDLDHCSGKDYEIVLLKDDKDKSKKIAINMYNNAIKKRQMSSVDFYEDIYKHQEIKLKEV